MVGLFLQREHAARYLEEALTELRDRDASPQAFEQRDSVAALERLDLGGNGRLRAVQGGGRACETALGRYRVEGAQLLVKHKAQVYLRVSSKGCVAGFG